VLDRVRPLSTGLLHVPEIAVALSSVHGVCTLDFCRWCGA
jgi:hypothetical protein